MSSKKRFTCIPAVYLLLEKEGNILLMRRANTGYRDGWYSLPAGHHDGGEFLTEAMAREAKEELHITVNPQDLTAAHVQYRLKCNDGERVDFYFRCTQWEGDIVNGEEEKCDDISWHALERLPENIIPSVKIALEGIKHGACFSEVSDEML